MKYSLAWMVLLGGALATGCSQRQWSMIDPYGLLADAYRKPLPVVPLNDLPPNAQGFHREPTAHAPTDKGLSANPTDRLGDKLRHPWASPGRRTWKYIVIHHSATPGGNAAEFDRDHRRRGWDELGYHFVITNGHGGRDGTVEVGPRWRKGKWGAHCGGTPDNEYNEHGIGVCLVGDFSRDLPSRAQRASLGKLVGFLAETYRIEPDRIITHRDAPNANTQCPGRLGRSYVLGPLRDVAAKRLAAGKPAGPLRRRMMLATSVSSRAGRR
ncbi:MAG: peptidoglycan recognition protein family protein [Planctomycetota bacterium]|jgi:hypothetical protein